MHSSEMPEEGDDLLRQLWAARRWVLVLVSLLQRRHDMLSQAALLQANLGKAGICPACHDVSIVTGGKLW